MDAEWCASSISMAMRKPISPATVGRTAPCFVYQMDSYHYWESFLGRDDFTFGQFGENFTVEGQTSLSG
ncbi:MAG: MOSC domain-containing protein [Candidatus Sulfotelmatobacter sp.]|jgi:MOSC domain-containing protein YiiM